MVSAYRVAAVRSVRAALFSRGLLDVLLFIEPFDVPPTLPDAGWGEAVTVAGGLSLAGSARLRAWLGRGLPDDRG